jgi:hypothetical protein
MGHVHKLFIVYAKSHASERERERAESISCPVTQLITEFTPLSAS